MARRRLWEWDKQGDGDFHANLHSGPNKLPTDVTLSSPSAELHQRTATDPETWVDRSSEVTLTPTIVDALDRNGDAESGGANRAVRVVITKDPDAQPDVTDEPEPGDGYRIKIIATRSDSSRPFADVVPLRILP